MSSQISLSTIIARCSEIQTSLGSRNVPEFETVSEIGMAVRVALQIRGLPLVDFNVLKLVCSHFLDIHSLAVERIVRLLAEVEFVRLQTEEKTIKGVLPTVPYYDDMYSQLGAFASAERTFNEHEQLALHLVNRLAASPDNLDALRSKSGADTRLFTRSVQIGVEGNYIISRRMRGRDILLNPAYFSENADVFADIVAKSGATSVTQVMNAIKSAQGWPLSKIEKAAKIGSLSISPDQVALLKRLAQDGVVKPPMIRTTHAGDNYFMFTPTPAGSALNATKRDIYEKAMAIVAAVRQGQLLPKRFAIRWPKAIIDALRTKKKLAANTEAMQQYRNLTHLRIGTLVRTSADYCEFHVNETPENIEALDIAYSLVTGSAMQGINVDDEARRALQEDQNYVESLIAGSKLREGTVVSLSEEQNHQLELMFMGLTV